MRNDFIPRQEGDLDEWEENFVAKLAIHSPALGIDPALEADCVAKIGDHRTSLNVSVQKKNEAKSANDDKNAKRRAAVAIIRDIAAKCKTSSAYTEAIGKELGIVGEEKTIDLNTVKPEIMYITHLNDQIVFDWPRGAMEGIVAFAAIRMQQRDTDLRLKDGVAESEDDLAGLALPQNLVWEEISRDYRSPWEDKRPNLIQQPEVRYYRFQYLYKDKLVGQFSDIIKVIAEIY